MRRVFIYTIMLFSLLSYSQVGINTNTPDTSSALDIVSTSGGVLIPRLTKIQKDAIESPTVGLMIYQTDEISGFYYYDDSNWVLFSNQVSQPSVDYNNQVKYTISGASDELHFVEIVSESSVYNNKNYTVSSNIIEVNHVNHGLEQGDFIYVYGSFLNNHYYEVTSVISNKYFQITSNEFSTTSGSDFIYSHAVKMENITISDTSINSMEFSIPSISNLQIHSVRINFNGSQDSNISITFPYNLVDENLIDLPIVLGKATDGSGWAGSLSAVPNINQSEPNKIIVSGVDNQSPILLKIIL